MISEHQHRDGDTMVLVTVESRPAVIDYADIREAVQVTPDEGMSDTPWENCDGYDHELRLPKNDCETDSEACIHHEGKYRIFSVPFDANLFNWFRQKGASRQVAREAVARSRQQTIEQLKKWYRDGWEWWAVSCDHLDESASVCGVDDYDYAVGDCADEIASEVAHNLEKKGYTVTNQPDRNAGYLENRRGCLRHNLLIGTWR